MARVHDDGHRGSLPDLKNCTLKRDEAHSHTLTRIDALIMAIICLLYGAVAFFRLGNTQSPESFVNMENKTAEITLDLNGGQVSHLMLYTGIGIGDYYIEYTTDGSDHYVLGQFRQSHAEVLKWQDVPLDYLITGGTIRITGTGNVWLGEVVALTADNKTVSTTSFDAAL